MTEAEGSEIVIAAPSTSTSPAGPSAAPSPSSSPVASFRPLVDDEEDQGLDVGELAELIGPMYADAFSVAATVYVGVPLEMSEERAARRGRQIGTVLKKLGWEDEEIICYAGLVAGVASDFAILHRAKLERQALLEEEPAPPKPPPKEAA